MSTMSFTEAADRIKGGLDIIDVIQRHVILKKSGRGYVGLCPFHKDKNPSMNVSREKNLFKCFSCGAGGDTLAFLMRLGNKTYGEVIRELAEEQGIDIISDGQRPEDLAQAKDIKQKILGLNTRSAQWFQNLLRTSEAAEAVRDYLARRGIDPDNAQRFGLGYAPPGWENLVQHLKNTDEAVKESQEILLTSGLATQKSEGSGYYDRFRHRLIIPIYDEKGQVIAFGGRALSDQDNPKYLNSPETPIYHKSRVLYGLNLAKDAIRQSRSAVIMEGYFDVISAHLAGVTQAVGSCGTALTDQHLKLLSRFGAETLYLAFDSDAAGLKAAGAAIALIEPYLGGHNGLSVKIVVLPPGTPYKDPDDFLRGAGGKAFQALLDTAQPFLDFKFAQALKGHNTKQAEGRIAAVTAITPMLSAITQPVLRAEMLHRYAQVIGVSEEALAMEVKRYEQRFSVSSYKHLQIFSQKKAISKYPSPYIKRNSLVVSDNLSELRGSLTPRHLAAEKNLLCLMLLNTECLNRILPQLQSIQWHEPTHKTLFDCLYQAWQNTDDDAPLSDLIHTATQALHTDNVNPQLIDLLAELVMNAEALGQTLGLSNTSSQDESDSLNPIDQEVQRHLTVIQAHHKRQQLIHLNQEIRRLENQAAPLNTPELSNLPSVCEMSAPEELQIIEHQYQMRDQLKQPERSPVTATHTPNEPEL